MQFPQGQFVTAQSMAATVTSKALFLSQFYGYAIQANYTTSGTLGGVLELQASVDHKEDPEGNILNAGHFVAIAGTPQTLSGSGSFIWNVTTSNYGYVRLVYTPAMGDTGSLNAFFDIKGP